MGQSLPCLVMQNFTQVTYANYTEGNWVVECGLQLPQHDQQGGPAGFPALPTLWGERNFVQNFTQVTYANVVGLLGQVLRRGAVHTAGDGGYASAQVHRRL